MTLRFVIVDWALFDNDGGASARITKVIVPEPATLSLLALGGVGLLIRPRG